MKVKFCCNCQNYRVMQSCIGKVLGYNVVNGSAAESWVTSRYETPSVTYIFSKKLGIMSNYVYLYHLSLFAGRMLKFQPFRSLIINNQVIFSWQNLSFDELGDACLSGLCIVIRYLGRWAGLNSKTRLGLLRLY